MSKLIPLTDAQLRVKAPSIFAESAIDNVSSQYNFVPTHEVLRTFKEAGYYPILAGECIYRSIRTTLPFEIGQFKMRYFL